MPMCGPRSPLQHTCFQTDSRLDGQELYWMNGMFLPGSKWFPQMCKWNAFTIDTLVRGLQGWQAANGKKFAIRPGGIRLLRCLDVRQP